MRGGKGFRETEGVTNNIQKENFINSAINNDLKMLDFENGEEEKTSFKKLKIKQKIFLIIISLHIIYSLHIIFENNPQRVIFLNLFFSIQLINNVLYGG